MSNRIREYLESSEVVGLAKKTRELYTYALRHLENFLKYYSAGKPESFDQLAWLRENFGKFATYLENKKIAGNSIKLYITCVKIFMVWAKHKVDYIYKITNVERQANKRKHLERWFDETDIEKCLAYTFPDHQHITQVKYMTIIRLLIETGARVGEISTIQKKDVDLENKWVTIHGKTEPRQVFFSQDTAMALIELFLNVPCETDYVFPKVNAIKCIVTEMLKSLRLKKEKDGRGPHTFRHYVATYLFYSCDVRLEDIAFLLGDTVDTIRKNYLHPTSSMLRDAISKAYKWSI